MQPAENEILLIGAGLQLYVFYLLDTGEALARKVSLLWAFNLAKLLINQLQQLDIVYSIIKYSPSSYFRVTTLTACSFYDLKIPTSLFF